MTLTDIYGKSIEITNFEKAKAQLKMYAEWEKTNPLMLDHKRGYNQDLYEKICSMNESAQDKIDTRFLAMCEKYREYSKASIESHANIGFGYGMRAYSRLKHFSTRKEDEQKERIERYIEKKAVSISVIKKAEKEYQIHLKYTIMKPTLELDNKQEKITRIIAYNPCKSERNTVVRYLLAVRRDNAKEVAYFESFGDSVKKIIINVRTYEQGLKFGFKNKDYNEYGWLKCNMNIVEEIELSIMNNICIGQAPNGKYAVSIHWCTGGAGGGSLPSIWDKPFDTLKDAIKSGVSSLQAQYNYALQHSISDGCNYNRKKTRALIASLKAITMRYLEPQQLSIQFAEFDDF